MIVEMIIAVHRASAANAPIIFIIARSLAPGTKQLLAFFSPAVTHCCAFWAMAFSRVFSVIINFCHIGYG
jgi:hypothetical protein